MLFRSRSDSVREHHAPVDALRPKISGWEYSMYLSQGAPHICVSLKSSGSHSLILTAETGAGKSTALPLALLNHHFYFADDQRGCISGHTNLLFII